MYREYTVNTAVFSICGIIWIEDRHSGWGYGKIKMGLRCVERLHGNPFLNGSFHSMSQVIAVKLAQLGGRVIPHSVGDDSDKFSKKLIFMVGAG